MFPTFLPDGLLIGSFWNLPNPPKVQSERLPSLTMQAANLVLLTWVALAFFVTTSANEDRLLSEKNRSNSGGLPLQISIDTGYLTTTESEERWGLNSIASKIKGLFSTNKNLSNKLSRTRLKPNVAASAEKIPSVKKVATAMENDPTVIQKLNDNPGVFKKLANDPQVVKTAATLEKNDIKVVKDTVNQIRVASANEPVKRSKLDVIDKVLGLGVEAVFVVIALGLLVASGFIIFSFVH
ncbi:unnamed protein product [Phytophthora fragariaefolia]|uniref:Unnamed protein product n=1 Tax=Phytophthora fragariaefolia TaxID=1490495 RepID=A0A9W6U2R4_9STRA|nr:unnamed protein product [Phytophthora fragariaefolia]